MHTKSISVDCHVHGHRHSVTLTININGRQTHQHLLPGAKHMSPGPSNTMEPQSPKIQPGTNSCLGTHQAKTKLAPPVPPDSAGQHSVAILDLNNSTDVTSQWKIRGDVPNQDTCHTDRFYHAVHSLHQDNPCHSAVTQQPAITVQEHTTRRMHELDPDHQKFNFFLIH